MKTLLLSIVVISSMALDQNMESIFEAMSSGQVDQLLTQMDDQIELHVLDHQTIYDKSLVRNHLQKFFQDHKPKSCQPIHKGANKSDETSFTIAKLTTDDGEYRVFFYKKKKGDKFLIQEMRIDTN